MVPTINVGIRAIMAREYSKGLSKNVKRGKETGAVSGKWGGGPRWYGYTLDPDGVCRGPKALDIAEAKILTEARDRYVAGESVSRIPDDFNARGIPTVTGKRWISENLLRLLLNKRYIGIRSHNGAEYPGTWPAIFTAEQYAELDAARRTAERMRTWPGRPTGARTYLLSGFLECARCGGQLRGAWRSGRSTNTGLGLAGSRAVGG
jgi:site-specific DNA recombinase